MASQSSIKIFARIKPVQGQTPTVYEINTSTKNEEILTVTGPRLSDEQRYLNNKPETYNFRYARVFDTSTSQDQIFQEVARPVFDSGLQGYNGTIFAYGQTGSGKTFTMTGSNAAYEHRGLTPRALEYIFSKFEEDHEVTHINSVAVSYLEIYNDTGYDLLHMSDFNERNIDESKVMILEDGNAHIHFKNLSVHPVQTLAEAFQMMMIGDRNRTIAETPMNDASTRSHCIFTIHLNVRDADSALVKRSKINLVDLAGSERIANSCATGHLLVEARHINLALHYLEQVIVALSEKNREHIPYRNSMMTQLLRDSLGGNCLTAMIATLSMEHRNLQETLSTNRFAQRVALVTNLPVPNEEVDPTLVISHLKSEIRRLKETIASSSIKTLNENENAQPLSREEQQSCESLVEEFLLDHEQNAILPIKPDMRLIQECFRLLKSQVGKPRNSQMGKIYGNTKLSDESSMAQLVARREAEIKVLVAMLKKEKSRNCPSTSCEDLVASISRERNNRGSRRSTPKDEFFDDPSSWLKENDFEEVRHARIQLDSAASHKDGVAVDKYEPLRNLSPKGNLHSMSTGNESLTNNLTGLKKKAMTSFIASYPGTPALDQVRTNLLKKREEIRSLETTIESQRNNMVALREVMATANNPETMYDAYKSQQRTCDMQKERLRKTQEQTAELETSLKGQFRYLLDDFEAWWREYQGSFTDNGLQVDSNQNLVPMVIEEPASGPASHLRTIGDELQVETNQIKSMPSKSSASGSGSIKTGSGKPPVQIAGGSQVSGSQADGKPVVLRGKNAVTQKLETTTWFTETNSKKLHSAQEDATPQDFYYIPANKKLTPRAPPVTPATSRAPAPTVQHDFGPQSQPQNEDNEEWVKDLPLTGHAETDKEIIKFFRSRRHYINTQSQSQTKLEKKGT